VIVSMIVSSLNIRSDATSYTFSGNWGASRSITPTPKEVDVMACSQLHHLLSGEGDPGRGSFCHLRGLGRTRDSNNQGRLRHLHSGKWTRCHRHLGRLRRRGHHNVAVLR
jgi:hypothetical protein